MESLGMEARAVEWGGTIDRGLAEIEENRSAGEGRVRKPGGGRKPKTEQDPTLLDDPRLHGGRL